MLKVIYHKLLYSYSMKDIPVLYCKLKKYERTSKAKSEDGGKLITRRYMIPVKKEQIEGSNFEDVEDIVILSKIDYDHELQKLRDTSSGVNELNQLLSEKDQEIVSFKELLSKKNQEVVNFKELLKVKDQEILQFKNILKEKNQKMIDLKDLHEIQVGELQVKLNKIDNEYQSEVKAFNIKMGEFNDLMDQYEHLKSGNKGLEKEIKRLTDLRTLEKESLRIKFNELEITKDEYNKLKKSHELLWDVVQEKDKIIRDMEKKGVVGNILKKIRKKEGA